VQQATLERRVLREMLVSRGPLESLGLLEQLVHKVHRVWLVQLDNLGRLDDVVTLVDLGFLALQETQVISYVPSLLILILLAYVDYDCLSQ